MDRTKTNDALLAEATRQNKGKQIKLLSEYYEKQREKLTGHLLRLVDGEIEKYCTFKDMVPLPYLNPIGRVGKPRLNSMEEGYRNIWRKYWEETGEEEPEMDTADRSHVQAINLLAHMRYF